MKYMHKLYPSSAVFSVNAPEGIFGVALEQAEKLFLVLCDNCHGELALKLHTVVLNYIYCSCFELYTLPLIFPLEKNGLTAIRKEMTGKSDCKLVLNLKTQMNCSNSVDITLKAF